MIFMMLLIQQSPIYSKGGFTTIYQQVLTERNKLIVQFQILEKQIKTFPAGTLLCVRNGKYTKWFKSNGANPTHLPKAERLTAEILAAKKYCSLQLEEISDELYILNRIINDYHKLKSKSSALLEESSPYKELVVSYFCAFPDVLSQWAISEYETNTGHLEHCIHGTFAGHKVRSKSEVIIANALFINKVPYRYECGLYLGDTLFFPDFTIRHPKTQETFYWEHFGMMNNHSYCEHAFNKLKIYSIHDIVPSINLITTYETQTHPIDSEYIQQLIHDFFL